MPWKTCPQKSYYSCTNQGHLPVYQCNPAMNFVELGLHPRSRFLISWANKIPRSLIVFEKAVSWLLVFWWIRIPDLSCSWGKSFCDLKSFYQMQFHGYCIPKSRVSWLQTGPTGYGNQTLMTTSPRLSISSTRSHGGSNRQPNEYLWGGPRTRLPAIAKGPAALPARRQSHQKILQ